MPKFCIQVLLDKGKPTERWAFIKAKYADEPYAFDTWDAANKALQLCYDVMVQNYRVVEVVES